MSTMTNYSALLVATWVVCAGTAAASSAAVAAQDAAPKAGPQAASKPAQPAAAPGTAAPATHYTQAAAGNSLAFGFMQADALNEGSFRKFSTELDYDDRNLAASTLKVTVQVASLDTRDQDRDDTLKSAELLDTAKYPTAQYVASSLAKRADGKIEAVGKLTLRGVTRELRLPLTLKPTASGLELSGETTIRRLDYEVGQGDWKSTEWVGNNIKLKYQVALIRAR